MCDHQRGGSSRNRSRSPPSDGEPLYGITRRRNIRVVQFGPYEMDTWFGNGAYFRDGSLSTQLGFTEYFNRPVKTKDTKCGPAKRRRTKGGSRKGVANRIVHDDVDMGLDEDATRSVRSRSNTNATKSQAIDFEADTSQDVAKEHDENKPQDAVSDVSNEIHPDPDPSEDTNGSANDQNVLNISLNSKQNASLSVSAIQTKTRDLESAQSPSLSKSKCIDSSISEEAPTNSGNCLDEPSAKFIAHSAPFIACAKGIGPRKAGIVGDFIKQAHSSATSSNTVPESFIPNPGRIATAKSGPANINKNNFKAEENRPVKAGSNGDVTNIATKHTGGTPYQLSGEVPNRQSNCIMGVVSKLGSETAVTNQQISQATPITAPTPNNNAGAPEPADGSVVCPEGSGGIKARTTRRINENSSLASSTTETPIHSFDRESSKTTSFHSNDGVLDSRLELKTHHLNGIDRKQGDDLNSKGAAVKMQTSNEILSIKCIVGPYLSTKGPHTISDETLDDQRKQDQKDISENADASGSLPNGVEAATVKREPLPQSNRRIEPKPDDERLSGMKIDGTRKLHAPNEPKPVNPDDLKPSERLDVKSPSKNNATDRVAHVHREAFRLDKLFVCSFCFKYTAKSSEMDAHTRACTRNTPRPIVGDLVYYDHAHETVIRRVCGYKHTLFCQNLALMGKLFLDDKLVYYSVESYDFFVVYGKDVFSTNLMPMGFFSKEQAPYEKNTNLACICVFPPFQRRRLGTLLIEFLYALARITPGQYLSGPELPLLPYGKATYCRYWCDRIAKYIVELDGNVQKLSTRQIANATRFRVEDILLALEYMHAIQKANADMVLHVEPVRKWFSEHQSGKQNGVLNWQCLAI